MDQTNKKPPRPKCRTVPSALAAFVKRPQAVLQIGAESLIPNLPSNRNLNRGCSEQRLTTSSKDPLQIKLSHKP